MQSSPPLPHDPIELEIFKQTLASIPEQMGITLQKTAYSPNIKERRDYSCALFDQTGELVAQGDHMPVHLGSMPASVGAALQEINMGAGDIVMLNDPFRGGTHLPDITLVAPIFSPDGKSCLFLANRAHHSDVGGVSPGSMPLSREIHEEGLRIPPLRLVEKDRLQGDVLALVLANVRTPTEREGDLLAQIASIETGKRRIEEITQKYGWEKVLMYCRILQDYAEVMTRKRLSQIPDGSYQFTDYLDDDGFSSEPLPIQVTVTIEGEQATIDFSGSAPQTEGMVNAVQAITLSAVYYVFRCLLGSDVPSNAGCMRPLNVITEKGSLLDATYPAAVAGGNVETSQRITDVLLGALAQAVPDAIPAASSGTMNNLTIGGIDPASGKPFAYYETIAGGMGASAEGPGLSGTHTNMTNSLNTPIEALENDYPFRIRRYGLRHGSGGRGRHSGGDGIIREIEFLCPSDVTILSERRTHPPYGLHGGEPGKPGKNQLLHSNGKVTNLRGKARFRATVGDVLSIESPGGGGWGKPKKK